MAFSLGLVLDQLVATRVKCVAPQPITVTNRVKSLDCSGFRCDIALGVRQPLMKEETGQDFYDLTSLFFVELPGIEPAALPGLLPGDLPVRYVSLPFSPARYLRLSFRVLTASRAFGSCPGVPSG